MPLTAFTIANVEQHEVVVLISRRIEQLIL